MKIVIAATRADAMHRAQELGWLPGIKFLVIHPGNYKTQLRGLCLTEEDVEWVNPWELQPSVELWILEYLDIIFAFTKSQASRDEID